uniref:TATA-box binding protein associated factor, RNA polymerase I subunit C n=1 Tax=Pseudonaja textilis TaxID=8673 RepID=A0A670Z8K4_PSETE
MAAFPAALLPGLFRAGPPGRDGLEAGLRVGGWGQCGQLGVAAGGPGAPPLFVPHRLRKARESWLPTEAAPLPLKPPGAAPPIEDASAGPALSALGSQLGRLFLDEPEAAFGATARLLHEHVYLGDSTDWVSAGGEAAAAAFPGALASRPLSGVASLCRDWLSELPLKLVAEWLHEDLAERRRRLAFDETPTGGALAWLPDGPRGEPPRRGCLVFPAGEAADRLCILRRERMGRGVPGRGAGAPPADASPALHFLGVRSAHFCGAWRRQRGRAPVPLQVVCTEPSSPRVAGLMELSASGTRGGLTPFPTRLRRLHRDRHNLFFRDLSSWRWSEFSAHPRVLTFADRTGLKGLDQRVSRCLLLTFLVGAEAGCQRGERLLLSKYLGHSEPFHHLVATQFSVFVLDERFPLVPVLSWEHMMQRPPIYAHLVPARPPQTSHKVLLGAHHSQEMLLLQYSGGHSFPCQLQGAPQKLPSIRDCLPHFPVQVPARQRALSRRGALGCLPAAPGCIAAAPGQREGIQTLLVFQLSGAGDLFYQALLPEASGEEAEGQAPSLADSGAAVVGRPHQDSVSPDGAKTACSPAAAALYRRWLRAWKRTAPPAQDRQCPPATLHQGCLFTHQELRETGGSSPSSQQASRRLHRAMREGHLSWGEESGVPVPPAPQGPLGELGQRLAASWVGDWVTWWLERLGSTKARRQQELREQRRRAKRRRGTQSLSGSFTSSTSYQSEPSDWSGDRSHLAPVTGPALPAEPPAQAPVPLLPSSQEGSPGLLSSQSLSARGIPRERRQTLRRYLAVLDQPPEPPEDDLPTSQASALGSSQRGPFSSQGPQPKRARMGF